MIIKIIKVISFILCISFVMWFLVSYMDVCIHNLSGGTDNSWNLFNLIVNK